MAGRLKLNLGREWRTDMKTRCTTRAPAWVASRARVLWLDWGVLTRAPDESELRDWLALCAGRLADACPANLRIVASLAIELGGAGNGDDADHRRQAHRRRQYRSKEFRASALDPLGRVEDPSEISDFLEEAGCPENLIDDLASWMHQASKGGEYALLRVLIAKAFATTWVDVHHDLHARYAR